MNFTNHLQSLDRQGAWTPLLMVGDFEGGKMTPYTNLMSQWPNPMTLGAADSTALAYDFGRYYGAEMTALGFNMAFAPVLDVNTNPDNPIIGPRSFGSTPELVSKLGLEVLAGNHEAGIISTVKHFPGHGDTSVDSHSGLPVLPFNRSRLENVDLAPFAAAVKAGVPALMTAHIAIPELDPSGLPATLSKPIITDLLRGELGFEGVVVTDSIGMKAVSENYGVLEAAGLAFEAGVDILLYTGSNRTQLLAYHDYLISELANGNLTEERVNQSVVRILKLKLEYDLWHRYPANQVGLDNLRAPAHLAAAKAMAEQSATLVSDETGLLPIKPEDYDSVLVVSPDNLLLDSGNLSLVDALSKRGFNVTGRPIGHQVSAGEIEAVLVAANSSELVILATHNFNWSPSYFDESQIELAEDLYSLSLNSSFRVILLSVENPYDLLRLPEFPTRVAAFNSLPVTMEAMAAAMTGEIAFVGTMPVTMPVAK